MRVSMAMAPLIRTASATDLPAIQTLLVETWHATYDGIYGPERVTEITGSWHSLDNLSRNLDQANSRFLVAEAGGVLVGTTFASLDGDGLVILNRLYVRPTSQGVGIGTRLLESALAAFPQARFVRLEVEPANAAAIRFYQRRGFSIAGEAREDSAGECPCHLTMERRL